ncbi:septal ring lytic transglycosylase RlpA family protein [Methylobacterium sp. J-068]|uniref:septal ring lytic transglycosylase RlpA family protein n=1 Tax=Methylobacterium sp. J-068 TaxID=2836649 RepID=UPI001FBAB325|nr:septal ring lytic transglycosylase RlpA family protein [Methylobacterium sp. J-068]MCJ2036190.1 septal ring lytic transglycosylase RlpA family protein [Methylobacterium sp. J-068]
MARSTKAGNQGPAPLPLWRLLAVSAVALTTANCAQNTQKFAGATSGGSGRDPKYGVKASPRLYNEGDVIPKGGGRRFSGKPYVVAGRTYVPREDAKGYVREGLASWYGSAFHGRMTANGEVFDRHSIAAAHPTLPLPSYARVTNLANGHSMIVRVNDRGPYHANRLMDVSEEVAEALEFRRSGTARVRVEYAGKASTAGSDDRKLLATLRTDGQPAAIRGQASVMVADLGPDAPQVSSERLARASRPALAFREAGERDAADTAAGQATSEAPEAAPAPVRPAPVLVASAATVAVPAALQPTAVRAETFRPVRHSPSDTHQAVAQAATRPAPLSLAPPPLRLAGARPEPVRPETRSRFAAAPIAVPAARSVAPLQAVAKSIAKPVVKPVPTRLAGVTPAPGASKAALARLAAEAAGPKAGLPKSGVAQVASARDFAPAKGFVPKEAAPAKPILVAKASGAAKASGVEKPGPTGKPTFVAKGTARGRAQFAEAR